MLGSKLIFRSPCLQSSFLFDDNFFVCLDIFFFDKITLSRMTYF